MKTLKTPCWTSVPSLALCLLVGLLTITAHGEDGSRLWLRYDPLDFKLIAGYHEKLQHLIVDGKSATMQVTAHELRFGLAGMLSRKITEGSEIQDGSLVVGRHGPTGLLATLLAPNETQGLAGEGFIILTKTINGKRLTIITGVQEAGILYGAFHFLRLLQTGQDITNLNIRSSPSRSLRMIHHWDLLE